jgi:hypothetical protein
MRPFVAVIETQSKVNSSALPAISVGWHQAGINNQNKAAAETKWPRENSLRK